MNKRISEGMNSKKNFFASLILLAAIVLSHVSIGFAVPDEGMFTPDQIDKLPLKQKGLKIKPQDLYNPNGVDISDAVVRLSIGCTGEFVSPQGLILTNHHCAFDALVAASSPEKDYGKLGYKADSMQTELPAKDYSIYITNRVEDVTGKIKTGTENLNGEALAAAIKQNIDKLTAEEQAKVANGATIRIQALNSGFFYYLYETVQIKDVRVVYAPPQSIGFFGGDPDNFEWSRHTGDFTFLRAYVAPDGKAAEFSPNNVPYKPKKFLTVSLNGVKENDFVFVMGYPGGTTRYRESQAVEYAQNVNFPFIVNYLKAWTEGLVKAGENDEAKRIKLQGEIFSLNNSIKAFDGGVIAMRRANVVEQKRADEARLAQWINADAARRAKYGTVLADLQKLSDEYYRTAERDRVLRTIPNPNATPVFAQLYDAITAVAQGKKLEDKKREEITKVFAAREPVVEREVVRYYLKAIADLPANQKFAAAENVFGRFDAAQRRAAEEVFAETITGKDFDSADKIIALYGKSIDDLRRDHPNLVEFVLGLSQERPQIAARTAAFNKDIDRLRVVYQQAMAEMRGVRPYPDANSTLRFTYGNVKGYMPREAVIYTPFTTLKGMLEKDTNVFPFDAPDELRELQRRQDFGRYGVGDSVPLNFLATTDIIGGNSGSPIMNANGELIGVVFDGNYEGLGNDIFFDPNYNRTIAVDIRFVLFVVEKYANAGWILKEMDIRGGRAMTAKK
jgi:hypothetical protein